MNQLNQLNQGQMDNSMFMMNQPNQLMNTQTNMFNSNYPNMNFPQTTSYPDTGLNNMPMNNLDPLLLTGTNLDDMDMSKQYTSKYQDNPGENSSLIKSLTKEIINNLKENNLSLYDNTSLISRKSYSNKNQSKEKPYLDSKSCSYDEDYIGSSNSKSSKKKKKNKIEETIEDFVIQNESNITNESVEAIESDVSWSKWFFDECFNYKDFIILFVLYFILSQEMIKDFFAKYFTSLNPDNEGRVGVQGVIIYGLILTVLFMVLRKLF
jgi:hypothetical protein